MNFSPFVGQVPAGSALPTIHQFASKLGYDGQGPGPGMMHEMRYHAGNNVQFVTNPAPPLTVDGLKFRQADGGVVVVSAAQPGAMIAGLAPIQVGQYRKKLPSFEISFEKDMGKCVEVDTGYAVNAGLKYQTISSSMNLGNIAYGGQTNFVQADSVHQMKEQRMDRREFREELLQHDLMSTMMQQQVAQAPLQQGQQFLVVLHEPKDAATITRVIKQEGRQERIASSQQEFISIGDVSDSATWQTLTGSGVADYLSALPLPLHQLLKYAPPDCKREETVLTANTNVIPITTITQVPSNSAVVQPVNLPQITNSDTDVNTVFVTNKQKLRKKKKCTEKDKKEQLKPGEIRLTTALDGSTLYCCPECHMAYPERGLLQQHLVGHTLERRFICEICNAALKRKDHLTRHKQSHNPDRPHVCTVCMKAFKRKEQLTLHFVIHSGEKRHVCNECGKGFYRKDHLRKHSRSHIARRVKAEMSQESEPSPPFTAAPAPAPAPAPPPQPNLPKGRLLRSSRSRL